MSEVQVFENGELGNVRIVIQDGEPWFVAKDVLETLEYAETSAPSRVIDFVPEIWKGVNRIHTLGGTQEMLCLSEQGLYFFLGRSDKPKALPYQMWIAGEVVPSIRKTGSYSVPETSEVPTLTQLERVRILREMLEAAGLTPDCIATGLNSMNRALTGEDLLALSGAELVAPVQAVALTPTEIGGELGLSGREINKILELHGYQEKLRGKWQPTETGKSYACMVSVNKAHSNGTPVLQLKWFATILPVIRDWLDWEI